MSAFKTRGFLLAMTIAAALGACAAPAPAPTAHTPLQGLPTPAATGASLKVPGLMKDLAGLRPSDIVGMLGQPDLRRDEPPAQLWQYRASDCVLTLFFYREVDGYRLMRAETWQHERTNLGARSRCRDETAPVRAHLSATQSAL